MDKELISSSIYLKKIIKRSFSSKSHRRYWCNNRKEVAMLPIFLWFFNCKLSLANLPSRFLLAFKCIFIRVLTEEHLSRSSHGLFLWSDRVTFGFQVQSLIERIEWWWCKSERGRQKWAFDGILIVSLDAPCFLHVNMALLPLPMHSGCRGLGSYLIQKMKQSWYRLLSPDAFQFVRHLCYGYCFVVFLVKKCQICRIGL